MFSGLNPGIISRRKPIFIDILSPVSLDSATMIKMSTKKLLLANLLVIAFASTYCGDKGGDGGAAPAPVENTGPGASVFKKAGCAACHHATKDQLGSGLGPSVAQIVEAYKGDKAGLLEFFVNGTKETARIAPEKFSTMNTQLPVIQGLPEEDRSALADYLSGQ